MAMWSPSMKNVWRIEKKKSIAMMNFCMWSKKENKKLIFVSPLIYDE